MEEKNYHAIIEAILFTMGESVELGKIAEAIELDKTQTKKIIEQMKEEYKSLVEELNELSEDFPATKDRMVEIAKILLAEHFNYKPKKKSE